MTKRTIPNFPAPPATLSARNVVHDDAWLLREAVLASRVLIGSMASYRGSSTAPLSAALDNAVTHWRAAAEEAHRRTGAAIQSPFQRMAPELMQWEG